MKNITTPSTFDLIPEDNQRLAGLCGEYDTNLKQMETRFRVKISHRGHLFCIDGQSSDVDQAEIVLRALYRDTEDRQVLTPDQVHLAMSQIPNDQNSAESGPDEIVVRLRRTTISGKNAHQRSYLRNILTHDLSFGIGPAGTGKTYLAVACAVQALADKEVERIVLARPAVEAGERLGFLPGDIGQKVDPYLRPLYDALYEMLGFERVGKLIERGVIELAPLAYMRGRTLNEAFVILDEAQNTTTAQMKMFLTRLGANSKAIITGDITQVDLPGEKQSGLIEVQNILNSIKGISFIYLTEVDVVRHQLVQEIIKAYERFEDNKEEKN